MDCVFCKIINGDIPSYTIYEDDCLKVFLDINPDSAGHALIVPKKHYEGLDDIDMVTLGNILKCAKDMKKMISDKLNCDGMTLIQNNGIVQEVKHFHLHLKPHYKRKIYMSVEDVFNILKK